MKRIERSAQTSAGKVSTPLIPRDLGDSDRSTVSTQKTCIHKATREDWETPPKVFDPLNREFNFTLDCCASATNKKCARYFDIKQNGLKQSWAGEIVWMNPPYNCEALLAWTTKAKEEQHHATIVCLLPVKTDQEWWRENVWQKPDLEIRWLPFRVKFIGAASSATDRHLIAIFHRHGRRACQLFRE